MPNRLDVARAVDLASSRVVVGAMARFRHSDRLGLLPLTGINGLPHLLGMLWADQFVIIRRAISNSAPVR
jgi:hypothetical protein